MSAAIRRPGTRRPARVGTCHERVCLRHFAFAPLRRRRVPGLRSALPGMTKEGGDQLRPVADVAETDQLSRMTAKLASCALAAGLTMFASLAHSTAPQAPIAAGPVDSVLEIIREANTCGFKRLRIELSPSSASIEPARLFLDDVPTEDADHCLDSWITANGVRLRLSPRWHGDTFEQTHHDFYVEARRRNPGSQP